MKKMIPALVGALLTVSFSAFAADEVPQAPFTYGGDETGAYAGGKVGTGVKDPSVCGTVDEAAWLKKYQDGLAK